MIDGIWWLVILILLIAGLWLIAKRRGGSAYDDPRNIYQSKADQSKANQNSSRQKPTRQNKVAASRPINPELQKTARVIERHFSHVQVTQKPNHLLIYHENQKVAMITLDKKVAVGARSLGGIPVINYHKIPTSSQLRQDLTPAPSA